LRETGLHRIQLGDSKTHKPIRRGNNSTNRFAPAAP
jgi:hypothetical protein